MYICTHICAQVYVPVTECWYSICRSVASDYLLQKVNHLGRVCMDSTPAVYD